MSVIVRLLPKLSHVDVGRDRSFGIAIRCSWTVRGPNPGKGEIFHTRPYRPWGPPSLLYNGFRVFPWLKRSGRGVDHPPHLVPKLKKEQGYTCTPPLALRGLFYGELYLYLYHYLYLYLYL
jgi:hypothetical protein